MSDDLAARRRAVAERLMDKHNRETLARLVEQEAVDHRAEAIAKSIRAHPSNHRRPYDREKDE